jgi:hypothetical protein
MHGRPVSSASARSNASSISASWSGRQTSGHASRIEPEGLASTTFLRIVLAGPSSTASKRWTPCSPRGAVNANSTLRPGACAVTR